MLDARAIITPPAKDDCGASTASRFLDNDGVINCDALRHFQLEMAQA